MGYDAACLLRLDGAAVRGIARLEHKDLVFRGPTRLAIPLSTITSATANGDTLRVRFGDRVGEFQIGTQAEKWAARIANPPSRLDKLGVKAGMRVALVGRMEPGFEAEVSARGASTLRRVPPRTTPVDVLFYAASSRAALDRLEALAKSIKPAGAIWIVRPKGQRAITEADTMAAGKRAGLVDVKVASFSETHTAEKFVIPVVKRPPSSRTGRSTRARRA
jgi:hypothetical protein